MIKLKFLLLLMLTASGCGSSQPAAKVDQTAAEDDPRFPTIDRGIGSISSTGAQITLADGTTISATIIGHTSEGQPIFSEDVIVDGKPGNFTALKGPNSNFVGVGAINESSLYWAGGGMSSIVPVNVGNISFSGPVSIITADETIEGTISIELDTNAGTFSGNGGGAEINGSYNGDTFSGTSYFQGEAGELLVGYYDLGEEYPSELNGIGVGESGGYVLIFVTQPQ